MIISPIHEYNHCHGASDGKFCSDPQLGAAVVGRMSPSKLLNKAFPKGALEITNPDRPKTIEDLVTFLIDGYAKAFGIPTFPIRILPVREERNIWGSGSPGGYYINAVNAANNPEDAASGADGNTLFLNPRTIEAVRGFLAATPDTPAKVRKQDLEDGLAVLVHEIAHSQSPQARNLNVQKVRNRENSERDLYVTRMLEEGMAAYIGTRAVQRLVPSARYKTEHQGYDAGRALWERLDQKHGADAVREAYRGKSTEDREDVLAKFFPNMGDKFERYAVMDAGNGIGPPNARNLARQVLEVAAVQKTTLLNRVLFARSVAELQAIKVEAQRVKDTLSPGQRFELAEQYGLKMHELRP